ncbi:LysR family transcriptional regulator [Rubellimicrobium rubrum]|uniref:LysR family transcriptional regulator n=1 Tax=Rubellimicrobium rubrum TaxID=2585369 RepID=A0A5C4MU52_9RHOB|nr:LysR family transcriptional regulator [Rubellimicrobium rubrum]TNC49437.1 LysR family transcriptional regulator [Rubellimicrobium rubrum]
MLDLSDLRVFARIADQGSLSAAARALRAPKSSVSRSLARLEDQVGQALVERTGRPARLTDAGRLLLPHALRLLSDAEEAEAALGAFAGAPRGDLRINAPYVFSQYLVAPMLPAFLARHPEVRVILEVTDRQIDIRGEEADVVIRVGRLADSGLIARKLLSIGLWLCASPGYLARAGHPGDPAELEGHALLTWADRPTTWDLRHADGRAARVEVPPRTVVPEPAALRAVLVGGAGIGRLPDFVAREAVARGDLVRLLPEWSGDAIPAHALYPSHRSLSAKVRVFIDALLTHLSMADREP